MEERVQEDKNERLDRTQYLIEEMCEGGRKTEKKRKHEKDKKIRGRYVWKKLNGKESKNKKYEQ